MKKIILLGDSIRMGYDGYVKESFDGIAEVWSPGFNCTFTTNILRNLHFWIEKKNLYDADAVHWNAGLWDTVRVYGDEPLVPLETYRENVERINRRMKFLFPKAKIIFATSTPCIEREYIEGFETRLNSDVERYNQAAVEVCEAQGVMVNDLYALLCELPEDYHSDQTHFYTAKATELIGTRVNRVICEAIGVEPETLKRPDSAKYESTNRYAGDRASFVKNGDYYESR